MATLDINELEQAYKEFEHARIACQQERNIHRSMLIALRDALRAGEQERIPQLLDLCDADAERVAAADREFARANDRMLKASSYGEPALTGGDHVEASQH